MLISLVILIIDFDQTCKLVGSRQGTDLLEPASK